MQRIGFYCWAGPGTIRMTKVKFFDPKIDQQSLMGSYDYDYLARVQEIFGITDVWATYSWGFSEKTEKEDYEFLYSKLGNFKKLNLRVHAYIQGTNVVTAEFPGVDWYSRDENNRFVTYLKGRRIVCVNNPGFVDYVVSKIQKTKGSGIDGIYLDNAIMGQMPPPLFSNKLPIVFAGCRCTYCINKFAEDTGKEIPVNFQQNTSLSEIYLIWRADCMKHFLATIGKTAHDQEMLFGSNSFDPKYNPFATYGVRLPDLDKIQDYIFFENWSFPTKTGSKNNLYIGDIVSELHKPVFVASYKYHIGIDKKYSQKDMDLLYSESVGKKYHLCLKGSEFYTKGVWHNLYINHYAAPKNNIPFNYRRSRNLRKARRLRRLFAIPFFKWIIRNYYNPLFTLSMENKSARLISMELLRISIIIDRNMRDTISLLQFYLITTVSIAAFLGFGLWLNQSPYLEQISSFTYSNVGVVIAIIFFFKVLGIVWPPFSGQIITLAFVPILGWFQSYIIDFTASLAGTTIAYAVARKWGEPIIRTILGEQFLKRIRSIKIRKGKEFEAILILNVLVGGIMIELASYAAGLFKLRYKHMLLGAVTGHLIWGIPSFLIYHNIIVRKHLGISITMVSVGIILLIKMRKRYIQRVSA